MSTPQLTTLVLGGYGNFGARICRALAGDERIQLLVAGRSAASAQALASTLGGGARGIALDHSAPGLVQALRTHSVGLVIHTAGPFQAQGYSSRRGRYPWKEKPRSCMHCRRHWSLAPAAMSTWE